MNVAWAVTDNTSRQQPWRSESFNGYFTDIQRAARKSLPRHPGKELTDLLGLKLVPAKLNNIKSLPKDQLRYCADVETAANRNSAVIQTATREPDVGVVDSYTESPVDKFKALFGCHSDPEDNCKTREKTVCGLSIYFAIIIFILMVIVVILVSTLSTQGENNSSNENVALLPTAASKTFPGTGTPTTAKPQTIKTTYKPTTLKPTKFKPFTLKPTTFEPTTNKPITPKPTTRTSKQTTFKPTTSITATSTSTPPIITKTLTAAATTSVSSTLTSATTTTLSTATTETSSAVTSTSQSTREITSMSFSVSTHSPGSFPLVEQQDIACQSAKCSSANVTMGRVDFTTSPCVDFYEFSCGDWITEREVGLSVDSLNSLPASIPLELRQDLLKQIQSILVEPYDESEILASRVSKRLYQSCVQSNTADGSVTDMVGVHALLDPLGVMRNATIQNTFDGMIRTLNNAFDTNPFFTITVLPVMSTKGYKVFGIKIAQPSLYLPLSSYGVDISQTDTITDYVNAVTRILYTYLTTFDTNPNGRKKRSMRYKRQDTTTGTSFIPPKFEEVYRSAHEAVQKSYAIEKAIANIINETSFPNTPSNILNVKFKTLKNQYTNINWAAAIGDISNNIPVEIENPDYFGALNTILPSYTEDDLMIHMFVHVLLQKMWPYMTLPYRSMVKSIGYNGNMIYSDIHCIETALHLAKEEIHALYIGRYTQNVLNNRMTFTALENAVSLTFQELVTESTWIQDDLQKEVVTRAKNLKLKFSPIVSNIRSSDGILGEDQSFLSLAIELHRQKYKVMFTKVGSNDTEDLSMEWTSPEVYFDSDRNQIGLPTGLAVYLSDDVPLFQLHAHLSQLIADKMVRILTGDLTGGVPPFWWSNINIQRYDNVSECFTSQLSQVQLSNYDIGNVILANGAFQIINKIFTQTVQNDATLEGTSFTETMLFYINTAQLHCEVQTSTTQHQLPKHRINNIMTNNIQFQEIFRCPEHSPLVTDKPCELL